MRKYLIVGPSWVGDMVMAQSLFKLIKSRHPDAIIDVVAPAWSVPILDRMPEVRNSITLATGHGEFKITDRWRLGRSLRHEGYTHSIVLPRSWKSALVPFAAKIPNRVGFHGEQRYFLLNVRRKLDKKALNQTVKRFVALGLERGEQLLPKHIAYPALTATKQPSDKLISKFKLSFDRPAVAFMPGAEYGPAKQWPLTHFRQLAEQLTQNGYQIWVIGGQKDHAAGEVITQNLDDSHNFCGATSLGEATDLLALTSSAVTNDSGLMHVAAAVGTMVHAIYGSSSEEYTPPLTQSKKTYSLELDCSPCFKRTCPFIHTNCLNGISAKEISDVILRMDSQ